MPARLHTAVLVPVVMGLALTACGSSDDGGSGGSSSKVSIKAGDSSCDVAKTSFAPGDIEFDVQNVGKDTTEVYVYGKGSDGEFDKVIGEVENIAPGTSRDFEVDVTGGEYEVACKPGQTGKGIRTEIEVSGPVSSSSAAAAYDREVEVTAKDFSLTGLEGFTAKAGEKIEFKLENSSTAHEHELEIFGPDGKAIGEVGPTQPGKQGEVVLELKVAGTYTYKCGIGDHAARGMKGSFTVTSS
ncbi:MAG: cupredoxin domain-containing protein [Mycobacteriales bacterium]